VGLVVARPEFGRAGAARRTPRVRRRWRSLEEIFGWFERSLSRMPVVGARHLRVMFICASARRPASRGPAGARCVPLDYSMPGYWVSRSATTCRRTPRPRFREVERKLIAAEALFATRSFTAQSGSFSKSRCAGSPFPVDPQAELQSARVRLPGEPLQVVRSFSRFVRQSPSRVVAVARVPAVAEPAVVEDEHFHAAFAAPSIIASRRFHRN